MTFMYELDPYSVDMYWIIDFES